VFGREEHTCIGERRTVKHPYDSHIEGGANPYLVLAVILGAGDLGIRFKLNLELTISDCLGAHMS
jgi:hypothetical protein